MAERSLLIAYLRSTRRIGARIVMGAIRELEGNYTRRRVSPAFVSAVVGVLAVLAALMIRPGLPGNLIDLIGSKGIARDRQMAASLDQSAVVPQGTPDQDRQAQETRRHDIRGGASVTTIQPWRSWPGCPRVSRGLMP